MPAPCSRAEKEALGRELAEAKEQCGKLEDALKTLFKQACSAHEEGASLASQLQHYRGRKQESEEQLVKDR